MTEIFANSAGGVESSQTLHALHDINSLTKFCFLPPSLSEPFFPLPSYWRSRIVQTVTTSHTSLINTSEYPPVFDGSKTIRPRSRKFCAAPPSANSKITETKLSDCKPAANNLQFRPPAPGSLTLKQLLAEAGEIEEMDSMHVSRFEKLMRSTNHNLLAIQPETLKTPSERCKKFLSVDKQRSAAISRADFGKSRQADELLCSLEGLFDFWNWLNLRLAGAMTSQAMRSRLKPRYQAC